MKNSVDLEKIVTKKGNFGDLEKDTEIEADIFLGRICKDFWSQIAEVSVIDIEGQKTVNTGSENGFWVCIDPLDGSLNYLTSRNGLGLPYGAGITVLAHRPARFADILATGVIDFRSGHIWTSLKSKKGEYKSFFNKKTLLRVRQETILDIGSQIVIAEMYYPENRELIEKAFVGEKGWLRNSGGAAFEMALVAGGVAVAYICKSQKNHELGAGYGLVKGAGGVVVDFEGNDLKDRSFEFNKQAPVILACNSEIADQILQKINFQIS